MATQKDHPEHPCFWCIGFILARCYNFQVMYTEIKEAVAFLFRYYRNNSPRRRVALLMTEFANLLMMKYKDTWDINDPTKGEDLRKVDLLRKDGDHRVVDKLFYTAADIMCFLEVVDRTPEIILYINPGRVYYKCGKEQSQPVEIWRGDVNADNNYNPMPLGCNNRVNQQRNLISTGKSIYLSGDAKNVSLNEVDDQHPLILHLEESNPRVHPSPIGIPLKTFVFYPKDHRPISVAKFSQTRFGSNKIRPDHDNMRRLQYAAAMNDIGNINII